jgi:ATP-dependent DNA ligase
MIAEQVKPITYPARPFNGGPLDKAIKKDNGWYYEPKFNGWRTLIHLPTGIMFNRHGKELSIQHEFKPAVKELQEAYPDLEWVDCEALGRRHDIGKGCLIVLDAVIQGTYEQRRSKLEVNRLLPLHGASSATFGFFTALTDSEFGLENAEALWETMQETNKFLGVEYFEGLVAKHADSHYPIQLRSSSDECSFWVKHRWAY